MDVNQILNDNKPSNRELVQAYVDSVLSNLENIKGIEEIKLSNDSFHLKSINSIIYYATELSSHGTTYNLIIDDSSKKIYSLPVFHGYYSIFLDIDLQLQILKSKKLTPILQEGSAYSELETFLNENNTFRTQFPNREILDSNIASNQSFAIGRRIKHGN